MKIAVIGAGPSGLTISHQLKKRGFENVTVFEKNQSPGGKVLSIIEENTRQVLEFGAVWVPFAYTTVRDLIEEFDVELIDAPNTQVTDLRPAMSNQKYIRYMLSKISKSTNLRNYLKDQNNENTFARPGFDFDIDEDYMMSFTDYLKKHKIEPLGDLFNPLDTGCGYGFPEEVPALYKLKFFDIVYRDIIMQLAPENRDKDRQTKYVKKGYQEIWKQVAKKQNIEFDAPITRIRHLQDENQQNKVALTVNGHQHEDVFDRVVVSSTGDNISAVLDDESMGYEKELFNHVETYPYYVSLFKAKDLDPDKLGVSLIAENATNKKAGHPTILAAPCAHLDDQLFMNWTVSQHELTDDEVENKLAEDVKKLGGKYQGKLIEKKWSNYFPHVKQEALKDINGKGGFYTQLNQLQGKKGIFYAGGLVGFETVEHTCSFGRALVEQKFH